MKKGEYLSTLLRVNQTVFSLKDIVILTNDTAQIAKNKISYYVKNGEFYAIRRGIYAKDRNYNKLELATKIFSPAYVSFETILAKEGLISQYYSQIFIATYLSREIKCDNQIYSFRKIKNEILVNGIGVENKNNIAIATKERAFLDVLYLNKDYYFDNLKSLDWKKVFDILPIYQNKKMTKRVNDIYDNYLKQEKL